MEVVNISISGTVVVKQPVSPMNFSNKLSSGYLSTSLKGTPFTISARYNTLVVYGCKNSVWLGANETSTLGGCTALCNTNSTEDSCNGVNCCQIAIPQRLKEIQYTYRTTEGTGNNSSCGYVFAADKEPLQKDYRNYKGQKLEFAPVVLEWEYHELKGYTNPVCIYSDDYCLSLPDEYGSRYRSWSNGSCESRNFNDYCHMYPTSYYCRSQSQSSKDSFISNYYDVDFSNYYNGYAAYTDYVSTTKYCSFPRGYEGNPYLPQGCLDVDECKLSKKDPCEPWTCENKKGDYVCRDTNRKHRARIKIPLISIGSVIGALILLLAAWKC